MAKTKKLTALGRKIEKAERKYNKMGYTPKSARRFAVEDAMSCKP